MPKGRTSHYDPPVEFTISLPRSLYTSFQQSLTAASGKVPYGLRSKVLQKLIQDYLRSTDG